MLRFILLACAIATAYAQSCGNPAIPPSEIASLIVGGTDATPHSWPWMVEIIRSDYGHYCGGTLINSEWVVSAAHCFAKKPKLADYQFSAGGHLENDLTETTRQTFDAVTVIRHENYNSQSSANDIALIRLSSPVTFNDNVSPACVSDTRPTDGTVAWVTGWGAQEVTFDPDLQQVDVPIVSQDTCQTAYPQYTIDPSMICAGYAQGGKDSCQGDSGGPVVQKDGDGYWNLVGITSWGIGCADAGYYGVYSDVSYLSEWIYSTLTANP